MTIRMDHVGVVVNDLEAAKALFIELGLEVEGEAPVTRPSVDRVNAIEGVRVDIAMLRTPDGHGKLELTKFHSPPAVSAGRESAPNTLGLHSVMFEVDNVDAAVAGLRAHGGTSWARWRSARTPIGSATSAAPRGSSPRLPSRSPDGP